MVLGLIDKTCESVLKYKEAVSKFKFLVTVS